MASEATRWARPGPLGAVLAGIRRARRAKEIRLTGKPFAAEQALDWRVINQFSELGALMEDLLATPHAICDNAPLSVRQAKKAIRHGLQTDLKRGLMFEIEAQRTAQPGV